MGIEEQSLQPFCYLDSQHHLQRPGGDRDRPGALHPAADDLDPRDQLHHGAARLAGVQHDRRPLVVRAHLPAHARRHVPNVGCPALADGSGALVAPATL